MGICPCMSWSISTRNSCSGWRPLASRLYPSMTVCVRLVLSTQFIIIVSLLWTGERTKGDWLMLNIVQSQGSISVINSCCSVDVCADVGHGTARGRRQNIFAGLEEMPHDSHLLWYLLQPREIPRPRAARSLRLTPCRGWWPGGKQGEGVVLVKEDYTVVWKEKIHW